MSVVRVLHPARGADGETVIRRRLAAGASSRTHEFLRRFFALASPCLTALTTGQPPRLLLLERRLQQGLQLGFRCAHRMVLL